MRVEVRAIGRCQSGGEGNEGDLSVEVNEGDVKVEVIVGDVRVE